MFSGDVEPEPGALPIYEDVHQTLASLDKLRAVEGAVVLLSELSIQIWRGEGVRGHIDDGESYLKLIDKLVRQVGGDLGGSLSRDKIAPHGLRELGLPEAAAGLSIVLTSFAAHLAIEPLDE